MLEFIENGLDWVLAAQSLGPWLQDPMLFASFLGTEFFFILVLPVVIWSYDYSLGLRLGLILMVSGAINGMLKLAFAMPRPFWVSSEVQPYSFESSFGFPSGHAQVAVTLWGRLAHGIRHLWAYLAAFLLVLVISFSRLYLGVHFPLDVLGGWLVGFLILVVFISLEEPTWRWFESQSTSLQLITMIVVSLFPLFLGAIIWSSSLSQALDPAWLALAGRAAPEEVIDDPRTVEGFITVSAVTLGLLIGAWQLHRIGGMDAKGSLSRRAARFGLGVFGVAALFLGLDLLSPAEGTLAAYLWRFLRYAGIGYWITYAAPRLFLALGIADASSHNKEGTEAVTP